MGYYNEQIQNNNERQEKVYKEDGHKTYHLQKECVEQLEKMLTNRIKIKFNVTRRQFRYMVD